MSAFELYSEGDNPHNLTDSGGSDEHTLALNQDYDALCPGEVSCAPDIPDDLPPSEDIQASERQETPPPLTIVEIGSGLCPILTSPDAPDIERLFRLGGTYIAIDPSTYALESGASTAADYLNMHAHPGAEIDARFEHAGIVAGQPLPDALTPSSADRVVISNVLTFPRVAEDSKLCRAIANAAMTIVRKDGSGEVLVVGTISPKVFPASRVTELLTSLGFTYVGADEVGLYYPANWRQDISPLAYALRYRPNNHNDVL
ncbi:MAG TPA: hypothetical protein VFM05_09170 [Candidatus Saccharimonadales bacterium]|nr:hypothetical protein [Candidatus Saccharimonadales bacterium]